MRICDCTGRWSPLIDKDYGVPLGLAVENGNGTFKREWSKATIYFDCRKNDSARFVFKSDDGSSDGSTPLMEVFPMLIWSSNKTDNALLAFAEAEENDEKGSAMAAGAAALPACAAGFKPNPRGPGYWTAPTVSDPPVCNASGVPSPPCHLENTMDKCAARCKSVSDCVVFEVGGGQYGTANSVSSQAIRKSLVTFLAIPTGFACVSRRVTSGTARWTRWLSLRFQTVE